MREIVKQIIVALEEDDWAIESDAIQHSKSFLTIDTRTIQPRYVPLKFSWLERRIVGRHVRKLRDRMMLAKLIEYRLNPRKPSSYSHENTFL